jgi:hypothetical protein
MDSGQEEKEYYVLGLNRGKRIAYEEVRNPE